MEHFLTSRRGVSSFFVADKFLYTSIALNWVRFNGLHLYQAAGCSRHPWHAVETPFLAVTPFLRGYKVNTHKLDEKKEEMEVLWLLHIWRKIQQQHQNTIFLMYFETFLSLFQSPLSCSILLTSLSEICDLLKLKGGLSHPHHIYPSYIQ